jgi:WD40 repeat protein
MNDSDTPLPLLELFNRLRKAGLPLGIEEYKLVLKALENGVGIQDQEALARLCRTLWVKSREENLLFNYHFQQVVNEWKAQFSHIQAVKAPVSESININQRLPFLALRFKWYWLISSALLLAAGIGGWLVTRPSRLCPYFTSTTLGKIVVGQEYHYTAVACNARATDPPPKITVSKKPTWLNIKNNSNGTVTLSGKPSRSYKYSIVSLFDLSGKFQGGFQDSNPVSNSPKLSASRPFNNFSKLPISSPNGQYVATEKNNRDINLWSLSGIKLSTLKHSGIVADKVFSPNSLSLATAAGDGLVRVWDLKGKLQKKIPLHQRAKQVLFSPNGKRLAILTEDGIVRLSNLFSNQLMEFGRHIDSLHGFSHDGQRLITINIQQDKAELWNLSGKRLASAPLNGLFYRFGIISEEWIISSSTASKNSTIYLQNWSGKKKVKLITDQDYNGLMIDPYIPYSISQNSQLIAGITNNEIRLWNLSGQQIRVMQNQDGFNSISFSPNGKLLVTTSGSKTIQLWDVADKLGKLLSTFGHSRLDFREVQFSDDGQKLISTGLSNSYTTILQATDEAGNTAIQSFDLQVKDPPSISENNNQKLIYLAITSGVFLLLLAGGYGIARWWLERIWF